VTFGQSAATWSWERQLKQHPVGTLMIGYPHVQALSQDKGQGGRVCPRVPRPRFPPSGLGQLRGRHVSPRPRFLPPGLGQLRGRHVPPRLWLSPPSSGQLQDRRVSPGLQHPPSGSGQLRSCHMSRGRALQATSN
jgi:hypothetical protein